MADDDAKERERGGMADNDDAKERGR